MNRPSPLHEVSPDRGISVRTRILLAALVLGTLAGCSSGGSGGGDGVVDPPTTPDGQFQTSSTPPAADMVYLVGGGGSGDLVTVNVAIGGPTTSSDLYSFAFDLVLDDPSVAQYVSGSADFGSVLTPGAGQGFSILASQAGDRVVVGVSKTGGGPGNGVSVPEAVVLGLTFRLLRMGTTSIGFAGPPGGSGPVALDSVGATIGSVQFDGSPAWISGI